MVPNLPISPERNAHGCWPLIYHRRTRLLDLLKVDLVEKKVSDPRDFRDTHMLPYVDLEDLSGNPSKLIGLLNYRARSSPEAWVHLDNYIIQQNWDFDRLLEQGVSDGIVTHGSEYAQWKDFDKCLVHRANAYDAPRSLLVLETQNRSFEFLRKIVCLILSSSSISIDSAASLTALPSLHLEAKEEISEQGRPQDRSKWAQVLDSDQHTIQSRTSLGSIWSQQSYSAPPKFDIDLLIDIADMRASEARDELWLL